MVCTHEEMKQWFSLVKRHKDFSGDVFLEVMNQDPAKVKVCATDAARELYKMNRAVQSEIHRMKGFSRLQVSSHRVLYSSLELEHRIIDFLLLHFHVRFPNFHILLETDGIVYGIRPDSELEVFYMTLSEALGVLEKRLPQDPDLSDSDPQEMWDIYYNSQAIDKRRNIGLYKSKVPRKYRAASETRIVHKTCSLLKYY
jgi:probable DNA metabolism protein